MLGFFENIVRFFDKEKIHYMLSGSVAMSIYVVPRATHDVDFVVHLQSEDVNKIAEHFANGYYCNKESINQAIHTEGMFNIIDHASGFKADFVILRSSLFRQTEFARRQQVEFMGIPVWIVSVEDLLISKLIWIQELQSGIQIQDVNTLLELETLDMVYIRFWIQQLNLNTFGIKI